MTPAICKNTSTGTTHYAKDFRDDKWYAVRKIGDGNCWFLQNLAIGPNRGLSSAYTNIDGTYTTPSVVTSGYAVGTTYYVQWMAEGEHRDKFTPTTSDTTDTGNFYTFTTLTAGTATSSMSSGDVTYNICPKNWTLPTYSQQMTIRSYWDAYVPALTGDYGDGNGGGRMNPGRTGWWWSRTIASSTGAYRMRSSDKTVQERVRHFGFPFRCIAKS